ncbi:nitroreductase/quinone reductase family protein [Streptomyces sp. NPDC087901]
MTNLVLTHPGRKTRRLLRAGLFFGEDDGRYILVASGSAITHTHPQRYLNLTANRIRRYACRSGPSGSLPAPARPRTGKGAAGR